MKRQKGFTLIELLVVIAIIALLMAILMPALGMVRKQARAVACQTKLKQLALAFSMYADSFDGSFPAGTQSGEEAWRSWLYAVQPYYKESEIKTCPMAEKPMSPTAKEGGIARTFEAWGPLWGPDGVQDLYPTPDDWPDPPPFSYTEKGNYVSFAANDWVRDDPRPTMTRQRHLLLWRTSNSKGASNIPLIGDTKDWYVVEPRHESIPPEWRDDDLVSFGGENAMKRVCIDRHNGYVNWAFVDFTVRRVGLKELWDLKWHRGFDTTYDPEWPQWMARYTK